MKKSKVVKSKSSTSSKRLKKYENGGRNILKEFTDPGLKGYPGPEPDDVSTSNVSTVVSSGNNTVSTDNKVESPTVSKKATPKAKLLPGGFTSEAQKKAYTQSLRNKIKSGMSVDELVRKGYGTKKGLTDLGLGKYSEGLDLKKKGQAKKAEGLALKNKAKNTDYKKQWNDNLLSKAASNKKLTTKESTYIRQKYGKDTDWRGIKKGGTSKEKLAYKNAGNQQLEKAKPEMRETLEGAVQMMTPRGIIKKGVEKLGQYTLKEGAKKLIGQGTKQIATKGSDKLVKVSKALKPDKILKPIKKTIPRSTNAGKTIKVDGRTVSEGSQKLLGNGQKMLGNTKGLPAPKKGLPVPKGGSKVAKETLVKARANRIVARSNKSAKIESSIKTNNPVARNMAKNTKYEEMAKKGSAKIKQTLKNNKAKNAKPKPGDQLKLNLRKGGKVTKSKK
jgi:hypothetical protein